MKRRARVSTELSRRERQIMDIVYAAKECSAADVRNAMSDPPSYSTVRKLLTILVEKGQLKHRRKDGRYFYRPTKSRGPAGRSALRRVLATFYDGSVEQAVAALLEARDAQLSDEELDLLRQLIDDARDKDR